MNQFYKLLPFTYFFIIVRGLEMPDSCNASQYYDPGALACQSCPSNVSMVVSSDGFFCTCAHHSIPAGINKCRPCNITDVVSTDGKSCVPRKCQSVAGKTVCRKCPQDYISVTQNLDGTPLKEVQCVTCARGYKPTNDVCVRCEHCACAKQEIVVRGRCVPKRFVNERPKHDQPTMHPNELLDVVKFEYFCTQNDLFACRALANVCVRSFYSTDLAGSCRFWIQPKFTTPKGLPKLTIETSSSNNDPNVIALTREMQSIKLVLAVYTSDGGLKILYEPNGKFPCSLPVTLKIGEDYSVDCNMNLSHTDASLNETLAPFLYVHGDVKPLPINIRNTNGQLVPRGTWPNSKFRRYFLVHNSLSITGNITNTIYLRTFFVRLRIERSKLKSPPLQLTISIEAQYASKSPLSQTVITSLRVENEMPTAGVLRGLEIWGGVLGAFLSLYALAQWRGNLRRGGLQFSLVPLLAGAIADTLYFAAWFSTLHALAAEAGTLGMTLSLSHAEEHVVKSFVYSAVALKGLQVAWVNYSQCKCDLFFLDWSEYNPPAKDSQISDKSENWRATTLAREWSRLQTLRRASPAYTVVLAIVILQFLRPWQSYLPKSLAYRWAVMTVAWWCAYVTVIGLRWTTDRIIGPPTSILAKVCINVGMSLLVFQEEYYAHYVHGRNDDSDARSLVGPLAACRVICAPQLRAIYKQLSTPGIGGLNEKDSKKALLSKFLATFFERALDGLSWVASERTLLERLLDVELVAREAGATSTLLYEADHASTPSCFTVTWWGEEWALGSFDAALFGCVFIATEEPLFASLTTIIAWQVLKFTRSWFGNKNQSEKTDIPMPMYVN